ncbi:hypothetical protein GCM10023338_07870 [Wohlfahrtiimonas larvae]|uniref:HTH cro/C1-type domain-containing protein n=1 Tax=Wohlfahrtiimonas larvae TaxID=1157986 RepID=A0ABP9MJ08_9GAMM
MRIKDLIYLSELEQFAVAYQLNISYQYLSEIKNRKINRLSRDLQLKIELFIIKNDLQSKIDARFNEIQSNIKPYKALP